MEMHQVRYFLAVCDELNFTRAAEHCHVSQPALTRAIQGLEDEFGGPLFHRERNNTHLTELGKLVRPYLTEVFEQTAAAKEQADKFGRLEDIRLKMGAMCTIGPAVIADFLIAYSHDNPGVEIEVVEATGRAVNELLRNGDVEVALYGLPEGLHDGFHAQPLFDEPFVIAVNADHRFAKVPAVRCRELNGERYVSRANCEFLDFAGQALLEMGTELHRVFSSESDDWVQGMIVAGLGLGFFPALSVTAPELISRPLIEPGFTRTINLVTARGRRHSPAVGTFVRAARHYEWPQAAA